MGNAVSFCSSGTVNATQILNTPIADSTNRIPIVTPNGGQDNNADSNRNDEVNIATEKENMDDIFQYRSLELSEIQETFLALEIMPFATKEQVCSTDLETPKSLSDLCIEAINQSECLDGEDIILLDLETRSFLMDPNLNLPAVSIQELPTQLKEPDLLETEEDENLLLQQFLSLFCSLANTNNISKPLPPFSHNYLEMFNTANCSLVGENDYYFNGYQQEYDFHDAVNDIFYLMENYSQNFENNILHAQSDFPEQLTSELILSNWDAHSLHSQSHEIYNSYDYLSARVTHGSQAFALASANLELPFDDNDIVNMDQSSNDHGSSIAIREEFPWSKDSILSYLKNENALLSSKEPLFGRSFNNDTLYSAKDDYLPYIEKHSKISKQEDIFLHSSTLDPENSMLSFYHSLNSVDLQNVLDHGCSDMRQTNFKGTLKKGTKHRRQGRAKKNKRRRASVSSSLNFSEEELRQLKAITNSQTKLQTDRQDKSREDSCSKSGIPMEVETSTCLLQDRELSLPCSSEFEEMEASSSDDACVPILSIKRFPASYQEAALAVSEVKAYFLIKSISGTMEFMPTECPVNIQHCMCSKIYLEAENMPDAQIEMISKPLNITPRCSQFPRTFESMIDDSLAGRGELRCKAFDDMVFEGQEIPENEIPADILYYMELGVVPWKWKTKLSFSKVISDSFIPFEVRKDSIQKLGWCPSSYDKLYCFEGHSKYLFSYKLLGCWECMRKHFNCLYKWCSNSRLIDYGGSINIKK